jgi:hypothetical protein
MEENLRDLFPDETLKRLPLNYRLITKKEFREDNSMKVRNASCSRYNAEKFSCISYYKPISRIVKK